MSVFGDVFGGAGEGGGLYDAYAEVRYIQPQSVASGANAPASWAVRPFNTIVDPYNMIVSLASNRFKLAEGNYDILAVLPVGSIGNHKARLWNYTDNQIVTRGESNFLSIAVPNIIICSLSVPVATQKEFEVHHYSTVFAAQAWGVASNLGFENYGMITIRRRV